MGRFRARIAANKCAQRYTTRGGARDNPKRAGHLIAIALRDAINKVPHTGLKVTSVGDMITIDAEIVDSISAPFTDRDRRPVCEIFAGMLTGSTQEEKDNGEKDSIENTAG